MRGASSPGPDQLALRPGLSVPVGALSMGNAQKVVVAQAFLAPVELVVLDEAGNGLDLSALAALRALVGDACRGGAAVLASAHHEAELAGAVRVLALSQGGLVERAPARTRPVVRVRLGDRLGTAPDRPFGSPRGERRGLGPPAGG